MKKIAKNIWQHKFAFWLTDFIIFDIQLNGTAVKLVIYYTRYLLNLIYASKYVILIFHKQK